MNFYSSPALLALLLVLMTGTIRHVGASISFTITADEADGVTVMEVDATYPEGQIVKCTATWEPMGEDGGLVIAMASEDPREVDEPASQCISDEEVLQDPEMETCVLIAQTSGQIFLGVGASTLMMT